MMATPNPVLPTDAERRRNRIYGDLRRARDAQLRGRIEGAEHIEQCATTVIDKLLDDLRRPAPNLAPIPVVDAVRNVGGYAITQPAAAQAARLGLSYSELLNVLNNGKATQIGETDKWSIAGNRYVLTVHPKNSQLLAVECNVTRDMR